MDERILDDVLARRPELSHEQAAMVRGLAESGDGLQVVLGRAGAGKTYALQPARQAWEAEGYNRCGRGEVTDTGEEPVYATRAG